MAEGCHDDSNKCLDDIDAIDIINNKETFPHSEALLDTPNVDIIYRDRYTPHFLCLQKQYSQLNPSNTARIVMRSGMQ